MTDSKSTTAKVETVPVPENTPDRYNVEDSELSRQARADKSNSAAVKVKDRTGRVLFEGPDKDARAFVENNFPRPHVQPGNFSKELEHDVSLGDSAATFDGANWSDRKEAD